MKHATTLVCIIWILLFLSGCAKNPESLPGPVRENTDIPYDHENLEPEDDMSQVPDPGSERRPENNFVGQEDENGSANSEPDLDSQAMTNTKLPLTDRVICLDPGHQAKIEWVKVPIAPDADFMMPDFSIGTRGAVSGVYEYDIALQVVRKLEKKLIKLGARVVLTRESNDEAVGNIERAEIANNAKADIAVRLHCDGIEDTAINGLSVLYPGDKYIKDQEMLKRSYELSDLILKSTVSSTKSKNRGLSKRNDLIAFNYSRIPCALIEMGFLTNPEEDRLLNSEEYQEKIADGIKQGILDYFISPELQVDE